MEATVPEGGKWSADQVRELHDRLFAEMHRLIDEIGKRHEQRFKAQEEALRSALATSDKALTKAEAALERRMEVANDVKALVLSRVEAIERRMAEMEGAAGIVRANRQSVMWLIGLVVTAVLALVAGVGGWLKK